MPQNTERGHRNSGGGSINSLESDSVRMESHKAMVLRTEHWRGAPPPGRRTQNEVGGWGWRRWKESPCRESRSQEAPREACPALTGLSASWARPHTPTDHREGTTYKMVHIWPDGAAFPRKTWPRSPRLQSPFKNGRECDHRQPSWRSQPFLSILEEGKPPTLPCPSPAPTCPGPPLEGRERRIFRPAIGPEK